MNHPNKYIQLVKDHIDRYDHNMTKRICIQLILLYVTWCITAMSIFDMRMIINCAIIALFLFSKFPLIWKQLNPKIVRKSVADRQKLMNEVKQDKLIWDVYLHEVDSSLLFLTFGLAGFEQHLISEYTSFRAPVWIGIIIFYAGLMLIKVSESGDLVETSSFITTFITR